MNINELNNITLFDRNKIIDVLKSKYYSFLYKKLAETTENPLEAIDFDKVWVDSAQKITNNYFKNDIYYWVYDCFYKQLIYNIRTKKAVPRKECFLLYRFSKDQTKTSCENDMKIINYIMSLMNRKLFDYFISKYYFLENIHNCRHEKKLKKLFSGKGEASILKWYNIKFINSSDVEYILYLEAISEHFISQIGIDNTIVPIAELNKFFTEQISFNSRRIALPIIIIIALVSIIALFFQCFIM